VKEVSGHDKQKLLRNGVGKDLILDELAYNNKYYSRRVVEVIPFIS
jgi:hypothetical protein